MIVLGRGWLIVFEGIDGTGKSTQCREMEAYLIKNKIPVSLFREPTDGIWGQKIRKILIDGRENLTREEELSWFVKDRQEDVDKNILPALKLNKVVLMDRYYYSTAAYQGALGMDPINILCENENFAPIPDRIYIFTAPAEECLARIESSRKSHSSFEKLDYLNQVQTIFDSFDANNIKRIKSSGTIKEIHTQLCADVHQLIGA
jgi:dTMP kinase